MTFLKKVWAFIIKSSADPKATSLSVKFALLGALPFLMQAIGLVCEFGRQCYEFNATVFEVAIMAIADGVFYSLSLISIIGTLYGLARKLHRTASGTNLAIKEDRVE